MGYEVKPAEVAVPEDDPFKNDRLDRRQTAEALSRFIGVIDGPCVVSLDAEWGMGKTTFLRMWQAHLHDQGFPVVMFNAWDNDFANEPFLAISEEIQSSLGEAAGGAGGTAGRLKNAAIDVLANAAPALVRTVATAAAGGVAGDVAAALAGHVMGLAEQDLTRYGAAKAAMNEFRAPLASAAEAEADVEGKRPPLVVLVDELDRCRPLYSVELLEVLKHLFAVRGVVFVLAVNRSQLANAVKALYGAEFDAEMYLRRFFDIDLHLPGVNRDRFIDAQMAAIWQQLHAIRDFEAGGWRQHEVALDWAKHFFGSPDIDLRTVQQALQRLGLVLAMLEGDLGEAVLSAMFTLILRTRDRDLYERFVNRKADDEDLAKKMFGWVIPAFRASDAGARLEAAMILAAMEAPPDSGHAVVEDYSRLYRGHNHRLQQVTWPTDDPDERRSRLILQFVGHAMNLLRRGQYPSFGNAVRQLELVAGDDREVTA